MDDVRLTEHTPLPWEVAPSRPGDGGSRPHDLVILGNRHEDEEGEGDVATTVAHVLGNLTSGSVTKANAELIVRAVRSYLAANPADDGEAVTGWRPIETAPKDGPEVLLSNGRWVMAGHWCAAEHGPASGGDWYEANNDPTDHWGGPISPTHWRPLPSPPSVR